MIDRQAQRMVREFEYRVAYQGIKIEDYLSMTGMTREGIAEQYKPEAAKTVRTSLVMEAVQKVENIQVTDEDLDAEIAKMAEAQKQSVEDFAKSVSEDTGLKTLNIPGCPPNPINLVGTIVNFLLFGKLPELDDKGRPLFAYGKTIHDQCPRRSHFEMGEFVPSFGSEEAKKGFCLYNVGCRGPETYNNCPTVKWNDGVSWPVQAGHPCIGCSEPNFWDKFTPFYKST
jgi:coenzyme F420-reducing hydrogenase gamma subunit